MKTFFKTLKLAGAVAAVLAVTAAPGLAAPTHHNTPAHRSATVPHKAVETHKATPHQSFTGSRFADRGFTDRNHRPADRFERRPVRPHHGHVWYKGHWRWERNRWVWVNGLWRVR